MQQAAYANGSAHRDHDASTRARILALVAEIGPVTAPDLARRLDLTPAAVRKHLSALMAERRVDTYLDHPHTGRRGRPASRYVATPAGQADLPMGYADLAAEVLGFLAEHMGDEAVDEFARTRIATMEHSYRTQVDEAGPSLEDRARALVAALSDDGYAATVRPTSGAAILQLCQGHCPVQRVAAEHPQLCDAETQAFSRLLGVHVQRLATLAGGGHACTTSIPIQRHPGQRHRKPGTNEAAGAQGRRK